MSDKTTASPTGETMTTIQQELFFGEGFLEDHAGSIVKDPHVAIIELIANSYDAGATEVRIEWPDKIGGKFSISDNGEGMDFEEFSIRWKTLNYTRQSHQGRFAANPNNIPGDKRVVFGRSGKGRHGAFCFSDSYELAARKGGKSFRVTIDKGLVGGQSPFRFSAAIHGSEDGHGARISSIISRNHLDEEDLRESVGSKFSVVPSFHIFLNNRPIHLLDLKDLHTVTLEIPGVGPVTIHQLDSERGNRTTHLRGICWWVNGRAVGNPSWEELDGEGAFLDGRVSLAKRYSFVVEADILEKYRKADWTGFHAGPEVNTVRQAVRHHIVKTLSELQSESRKERKSAALAQTKHALRDMTHISRQQVAAFVDEIQEKCPTISERDLTRATEIFSKMEIAKTGYDLLKQLQACSPEDIDTWNELMSRWTAKSAALVLHELESRLRLIERLQGLVHSKTADELHDIQPLFERGLWIFGPEYEGVQFHSNRGLATIIRKSLGGTAEPLPKARPDFVALPGRSIGAYAAPAYDSDNGEISGIGKVLLVELKRGGFKLTQDEVDQARNYAKALTKAGDVQPNTQIVGYVLGATLEDGLEKITHGERITILPMKYDTFLERAQSRTFQLQRRIEQIGSELTKDEIVEELLAQDEFEIP